MAVSVKSNRNIGLDVLRALAMFFVICQHLLGQGGLVANAAAGSGKFWFLSFLQILVYCSVNIYGITTGYLLCEKSFRLSRLTKVWLTTVFWSVVVSCCFFLFVPESRSLTEAISMFLPVLRGRYWFFTAYFVVMLVSPVLNLVIRTLTKRQFHLLFAALFLIFGIIPAAALGNDVLRISSGHHFSWMIVLYLIGGYFRLHPPSAKVHSRFWLLGYFLFALIHLVYKFLVSAIGLPNFGDLLLTYPSPLILGEAICLFLFCKNAFRNMSADGFIGKLIRFISPGVYSVYIIHVHPLVFWNHGIIGLFRSWDHLGSVAVFVRLALTSIAVFTVCIVLDFLRQHLFRIIGIDRSAQRWSDKLEALVRTYIR